MFDGHIDSAATGQGAFFQLADLHIADLVYRGSDQHRRAGPRPQGLMPPTVGACARG